MAQEGLFTLPERIVGLRSLAYDLSWAWHQNAREVFRQLDYALWRLTSHNPVRMLPMVSPERLSEAAQERSFLALYDAAIEHLDRARTAKHTWWSVRFPDLSARPLAYFSAEFALHQSLPIYAGGLGVLAGDLCKEASDLGIPLVGVGFMYPQGYFHQRISSAEWQEESYERLNWDHAPVERLADGNQPRLVRVPLGARHVYVSVWMVRLGRVSLFLLDTDLEQNAPEDRELSARLYGGDRQTRLQQEIILGIGGVRVLRALGYDPMIWHLNEGHTAFLVLERIREALESGESFEAALKTVESSTVFTTHTPVAAGHDAFPFHMVEAQLAGLWGAFKQHQTKILELGRYDNGDGSLFNMTALALRTAGDINAVSQLHGSVTREMWAPIWSDRPGGARTIKVVTNGIHVPSWIAPDLARLFERHLGKEWLNHHDETDLWEDIFRIPDEELWNVRQELRSYLIAFMRERARQLWAEEKVSSSRIVAAGTLLDPAALTIGFARRFTGYKRADLVFHDPDRLARILTAPRRPVQIIFAGKAHPADENGKRIVHETYQRAVDPSFGGRIAFMEDYDLHVAHFLVQGCDVWMNTPQKPYEASGTSGMKASINGGIHLSVGDGWWAEGYTGSNGWLIEGVGDDDSSMTNSAEAEALYRLLEVEIIPAFYDRNESGIPTRWLRIVKEAIRTVMPRFSARRMMKQYAEEMYEPLAGSEALSAPSRTPNG
ncbi:MAG: alpha-glucan family phosphorylase [Acidimicrobiales bacterium]